MRDHAEDLDKARNIADEIRKLMDAMIQRYENAIRAALKDKP